MHAETEPDIEKDETPACPTERINRGLIFPCLIC